MSGIARHHGIKINYTQRLSVLRIEENIVDLGIDFLLQLSQKYHFTPDDIDWFLPHLSSMLFQEKILTESKEKGFFIPENKWFIKIESDADQVELADLLDYSDYKEEVE